MLEYVDTPYEYFPPRPNRFLIGLFRLYNRLVYLPGAELRIGGVDVSCDPSWSGLTRAQRQRCLFVPNHCTHADPQIVMETHRQLGCGSTFMAAYDVFQRDAFRAWIMQKSGAFSVDREGADKLAMKEAIRILKKGTYGLTVFAEGNVYLQNDRVTPFLDGTAFIGLKAQKELGMDEAVHVVPLSLKVTHETDARATIREHLDALAAAVRTEIDGSASIESELERVGVLLLRQVLARKDIQVDVSEGADLHDLLERVGESLIARLEERMSVVAREGASTLDRFQKLRRQIHQIRLNPDKADQHAEAARWADDAILAFRVLSYSGTYLGTSPSLDRVGETVEKLCEDRYSKLMPPFGVRRAMVHVGAPIDLRQWMTPYAEGARGAMQELTQTLEESVQAGVDHLNRGNTSAGVRPFEGDR